MLSSTFNVNYLCSDGYTNLILNYDIFIENLKIWISDNNFTTQIAADKLGVSRSLLRFWFNGGTMRISLYNKIKGNLAHYNSHSALYRPSNTPANISISLLEIPNRVANSRHPFTASITPEIIFSAVLRFSM